MLPSPRVECVQPDAWMDLTCITSLRREITVAVSPDLRQDVVHVARVVGLRIHMTCVYRDCLAQFVILPCGFGFIPHSTRYTYFMAHWLVHVALTSSPCWPLEQRVALA